MQEILINIEAGERRVAILRSKRLEWYFVERINERRIGGNIYKGKVSSVLNGMRAAFVDCGLEKNGFLYVSDIITPAVAEEGEEFDFSVANEKPVSHKRQRYVSISNLVKKGQDVLVQVVKEGIGTKGARLNTHLSLPGRYLVLMPSSKRIGVSRKIRDEKERKRIKTVLHELKLPGEIGLVARTAAEGGTKKEFIRDIRYLLDTYNKITRLSNKSKAPSLLFEELDLSLKTVRDYLTSDTSKIVLDEKAEYKKVKHFLGRIASGANTKVLFHRDDTALFEKYGIEKELDKLFERKIYLKCGGYITLEQTEGMVAIDVNSGKFTGRKDLEDTVFKVNCEAAEVVARQLRLRDTGGIVVIDFIDMSSQQNRKQVFSILQSALKKDRAKTNIISLSELDIVEMTRQRVRRSLESVSYRSCPYCDGKGMVKDVSTVVIIALRRLKAFLKTHRARSIPIELFVHPHVAQRLVNEDARSVDFLRRTFRRQIAVVSDDTLHIEEVKVAPVR